MKIIYDNEQQGYVIIFEGNDRLPLFINTDDIVEARDYLVEHMIYEFNSAIQEQLAEGCTEERDERYEDWCFDCDYCKDGVCEHNINCEDGEMWNPKVFEDGLVEDEGDAIEDGLDVDDLINVIKNNNGYTLGDLSIVHTEESACDSCLSNPKNGGDGICSCILGQVHFY